MHTFGASAPLKGLLTKFGFTPAQAIGLSPGDRVQHRIFSTATR
jgi:hypothetical protein